MHFSFTLNQAAVVNHMTSFHGGIQYHPLNGLESECPAFFFKKKEIQSLVAGHAYNLHPGGVSVFLFQAFMMSRANQTRFNWTGGTCAGLTP